MKKVFLHSLMLMMVLSFGVQARLEAQGLSKEDAMAQQKEVLKAWRDTVKTNLDYITKGQAIVHGDLKMPVSCSVFGSCPEDGYSLFISLHGGGNTATEVNDQQWQNQWYLYQPKNAIYICPRAPYDDWDMHFKPALDAFYEDIILYAYTHLRINPDKVYIMGYSAGGDGVWRLAPRMADHWAAASMMAGHPGTIRMENLRNVPYSIWCGKNDWAYNRNKLCAERILQLDSLQQADPEGYIHEDHIMEGKGHWMDRADTLAVEWMQQYRRNPYPKKVVWRQEEVLRPNMYWLSVYGQDMEVGKEIRLQVDGNTINIERCDYPTLTLWLNDEIVDLNKKITIRKNGRKLFSGKVKRLRENMEESVNQLKDPRYAFPGKVELRNIVKR